MDRREKNDRARKSRCRRAGAWCGLLMFVGLTLAGCGGSVSSGPETPTQASVVSNASNRQAPPTAPAGGGPRSSQFSGHAGVRKFQTLANAICSTVRTGSPAPLPQSAKPADLNRYAAAASETTRRTIVSLQRLGAPPSLHAPLERLLDSLRELQLVYEETSSASHHQANVQSIAMAEARAGSEALMSGTPACAPRPPGVGSPRPSSHFEGGH